MIKGVRVAGTGAALSYLNTLELPIIENTPNEEDLKDSMAAAMVKYPDAAGVLVRRHGVYVWGMSSVAMCSQTLTLCLFQGWTGKKPRLRQRSGPVVSC
jgi:ribulose-5-phosphate 4-epimerase/fuculose-1-phosphate aldolase